jgi:hypothetical protein
MIIFVKKQKTGLTHTVSFLSILAGSFQSQYSLKGNKVHEDEYSDSINSLINDPNRSRDHGLDRLIQGDKSDPRSSTIIQAREGSWVAIRVATCRRRSCADFRRVYYIINKFILYRARFARSECETETGVITTTRYTPCSTQKACSH